MGRLHCGRRTWACPLTVDYLLPMRVVQRFSQVLGYLHRFVHWKLVLAVEAISESVPLDIWHYEEEETVCLA